MVTYTLFPEFQTWVRRVRYTAATLILWRSKKEIDVPDNMAGMVQITKIQDYYYITISTDITGSQDYATIIRTRSLDKLASSDYEDIYSTYFAGGGTPYYISQADDTYFLTEHRLKDHSIWSFKVEKNKITDVQSLY